MQYRLSGPDIAKVREFSQSLAGIVRANPHLDHVVFDWMEPARVVKVDVLQDKARQLGVSSEDIATTLNGVLAGSSVTQVRDSIYLVNVMGRATAPERASIDTLRDLQLIGLGGQSVPLGAVATLRYEIEQPTIWRRSRIPTITLKASILDTVQPKTIVDQLAPKVDEFAKGLPAGYSVTIGGSVEESAKSQAPIAAVVPLMLFIMATILMIQLQSFHRLFLVFAVAPLALIGVVMALLPSGAPLGFVAILGVLALIGILIRNSVILIVQIEQLKEEGRPVWDAVVEATEHRMRPIMLTAAAASLALIPIAREIFWGPMAYAMMGGIIVGTLLTLLFLPALYVAWFRIKEPEPAMENIHENPLAPELQAVFQPTRPLSANWKMHRSPYEASSESLHVRNLGIVLRCVLCRPQAGCRHLRLRGRSSPAIAARKLHLRLPAARYICHSVVARCRAAAVTESCLASARRRDQCYEPRPRLLKTQGPSHESSNQARISAMQRKHTFAGLVLLSSMLVPSAPWLNSTTIVERVRPKRPGAPGIKHGVRSAFPCAVPCRVAFAHSGDRYCRTVACRITDRRDYVRYIGPSVLSGEDRQKQRDMGKRHRR